MNPNQRSAMTQALGAAPSAQMPPAGPPPGAAPAGPPADAGAQMAPEQAQQFLSSLGITPDNLPMVVQAIDVVTNGMGAGGPGAAPGGPPPA